MKIDWGRFARVLRDVVVGLGFCWGVLELVMSDCLAPKVIGFIIVGILAVFCLALYWMY